MSFSDDEPIATPQDSGAMGSTLLSGRVMLKCINNNEVPLEETKFKVMLELTGGDCTNDRSGLDLVAVLDVSGSMAGEKIQKLKTAMLFVLKKLSSIDRLSIVTFSGNAKRLCPLRQITETSQPELEKIINGLTAKSRTNITDGLQTGLKVLNDRKLNAGRVVGIMLMSDGQQNRGGDASRVKVGNVPVHTFGFGVDHDPKVLKAIAGNSRGGTFSYIQDTDKLSIPFSMCLAGLLTVVAQDLKLTVTGIEDESKIEQVSAGSYAPPKKQNYDAAPAPITISFGDLYSREVRKVIVDLLLSQIPENESDEPEDCEVDILQICYSYRCRGRLFESSPVFVTVRRMETSAEQEEKAEVITEETRVQTAEMMKEARVMADGKDLQNARGKLAEAKYLLDSVDHGSPLVGMLKAEVQDMSKLMDSQNMYEKLGRPYALSSEISHDRQRFGLRGDSNNLQLFSTPRMDEYQGQARKFA